VRSGVQLEADPTGCVGVILVLAEAGGFELARTRRLLAGRIPAVLRLRQRLVRMPIGCGAIWADDPAFYIRRHVCAVAFPEPVSVSATGAVPDRLRQVAGQIRATSGRDRPTAHRAAGWLFRPQAALGGYHQCRARRTRPDHPRPGGPAVSTAASDVGRRELASEASRYPQG
jgi:hypothetical protein